MMNNHNIIGKKSSPLFLKIFFPLVTAFVIVFATAFFVVKENEVVFIVEFGKIVRSVTKSGLNMRVPFVQEVLVFDKRVMEVDTPAREIISSDQKRLIVDAYVKYLISDPYKFFQTLKNQEIAENRLKTIIDSSMRRVIAKRPLSALLTEQRSDIMDEVTKNVSEQAQSFGLNIIDVRLIRVDLPVENSEAVFSRMRTDREIEAKQLRAQGQEEAQKITSKADREVREIIAKANMQAEITKGRADNKAAGIYNAAFSKDPEFFKFYRTMQAYKKTTDKKNTKAVVSTSSEFWKELKNSDK